MNAVLEDIWDAQTYMDDIAVHSKRREEHLDQWENLFFLISNHQLKQKVVKRKLTKEEVELLGHTVSKDSVLMDQIILRQFEMLRRHVIRRLSENFCD